MEYRRYESVVESFSGSSSDYDKSDDELSYNEDCYTSKFFGREETGSRLFRRWFLNIIDLPNSLTNRLRDWLRAPPGSRGSTSDKSSGTNSVHHSENHLTGSAESDYDDYEKWNGSRHGDGTRKNYRAPGVHRPLKNHHIYHVYKQNEMEFQRGVRGQLDYSTSWLQRNGRFSSSPVLVLPRIDPDTGQPIFHPSSYHSRTSTERRSITRRNENWRSGAWELKSNRYSRLRGDKDGTGDSADRQNSSKPKITMELDAKSAKLNVTASTAFRETISMRLNLDDSQSFSRTVSVDENNSDKIKTENTVEKNSSEIPLLPRVPSLTQPNVEELLRSLRQKINSLNAEKKFNDPLGHVSSLIRSETGPRRRDNLFSARWQDKSDFFRKDTRTTYGEARASFTERIQDIWIQEKTSSQWAVLHRHGTHVSTDVNSKILNIEDISDEKKINHYLVGKNMKIDGNEDFRVEKEINRYSADKNMRNDENEYLTKEKITNCNSADKNIKTDENGDCANEKKINLNVTDKNIKTGESKDFTKDEKINGSITDNNAKIDIDKGSEEKKINFNIRNKNMKIDRNEDCQETKTDCTETESNGRGDDEALISSFSSSNDNEMSKPIVCHAAVQYSVPEANVSKELNRPRVLPSRNNDDKPEIQIKLLEPLDNYNKITVDSTQFAAAQEIEVFSQCWTEVSTGFASTRPFISIQSKTTEATAEKLNRFSESTPEKNVSLPENAPRNIIDKISKLLFKLPSKKRLRNPLTRLPKIVLGPSTRFSRAPRLRSKKSRFTKKFRSWLVQKFSSNRRSSSFSRSSKLGCMAIVFKCTEKSSESSLPAIVRPTPPMRRKRRVRIFPLAPTEAMAETEKNRESILDENSTTERAEEIGVDSSAIELGSSSSCKMHCERSMTTLSVTTSNSTNIPLQLLGSTSDTNVVPSHDSQDDFKPRLAEITTRKPEIETCEETDDCRADLSSTASNIPSDEKSNIFKFGDVLDMSDCCDQRTENSVEKKSRRVNPARKISRSRENSLKVIAGEKKINRYASDENMRIDENDDFAEEKNVDLYVGGKNMRVDGNKDFTTEKKINYYDPDIIVMPIKRRNNDEHLSSTAPNLRTEEKSKIFEFGDVLKLSNRCAPKTKIGVEKKSTRVDRARKISRSRENSPKVIAREKKINRYASDKNMRIDENDDFADEKNVDRYVGGKKMKVDGNKDFTTEKKINYYDPDIIVMPIKTRNNDEDLSSTAPNLRTEEKSKIFEFGDVLKMSNRCAPKTKSGVDKKSRRVDPARKTSRSRENSPILRRRRADAGTEKIIVNKKRSLDIENLPSRKGVQNKIGKISLEAKSGNIMRLNCRESIIDIAVDEFMKRESKCEILETRDSSDKSANRKSLRDTPKDEPSVDRKELKNLEKSQKTQIRGLHSAGFYPDLMPAIKKLRQRADSPMIRNASDSPKRKNSPSIKSSLIPIGIENSKILSKKNTRANEKNSSEDKNRNSLNSQKCRPSLKKSSKYSSASGGKKVSNHRVHFELEKSSSKQAESTSGLKRKIDECEYDDLSRKMIYGSSLREMDNKLLVSKIKSSLANGMPLKRITIVDPQSAIDKSKSDREGRSRVEKAVIDRPGKSRADSRNLTSRSERTEAISRAHKEPAGRTCPRRAPSLSGQIPKLEGSFEKRRPKENKLSYRSRTRNEDKSYSNDRPVQRASENLKESIVDLTAIKERVDNEILDRTSRTSDTGDSDCAIALIKAINSSMELSDVI